MQLHVYHLYDIASLHLTSPATSMLIKMSREKVENCCVDTTICRFMHNNYNRQLSNCCSDRPTGCINTHKHKRKHIQRQVLVRSATVHTLLFLCCCMLLSHFVVGCCWCCAKCKSLPTMLRHNSKTTTHQQQQVQRRYFHNLTAPNGDVECPPSERLCNVFVQHILLARRL